MTSNIIDTKFCTSCQATQPLAGGQVKQTRDRPRWVCQGCLERKYESIYKSRRDDARPRGQA